MSSRIVVMLSPGHEGQTYLTGSAPRDVAAFERDHARLFAPAAAIR